MIPASVGVRRRSLWIATDRYPYPSVVQRSFVAGSNYLRDFALAISIAACLNRLPEPEGGLS